MIHYTKGITRGCCNIISQLINHNGSDGLCNLYVYFDRNVVNNSYNLTVFGSPVASPINLINIPAAETALFNHIQLNYQVGSVNMIIEDDKSLLIIVYSTDMPAGNAQIEAVLFTDIVTEGIASSCNSFLELRDDGGFELREGGGFELRE